MNEKEFMKKVGINIIQLVKENKIITENILPKRMNSYERNYLMQFYDDKLLIKEIKYYIFQCSGLFRKTPYYYLESAYSKTLKHKLIHSLLERFEIIFNENTKLKETINELNEMIDDI